MRYRKIYTRVVPAQPEYVGETVGSEYTCDRCGGRMPEYNASGGFLPKIEGAVPRSKLFVQLSRENFSDSQEDSQRVDRDYCDECIPAVWEQITAVLAYGRRES